jgi:predicted regulator of amino acid metabolism with ACT domain
LPREITSLVATAPILAGVIAAIEAVLATTKKSTLSVRFALKSPPPVNPVPAEMVVVESGVPSDVLAAALSADCIKESISVDTVRLAISR